MITPIEAAEKLEALAKRQEDFVHGSNEYALLLRASASLLRQMSGALGVESAIGCRAGRDGECSWQGCPQLRDNEPKASGRHCPYDVACGDPSCDAVATARAAIRFYIARSALTPSHPGETP